MISIVSVLILRLSFYKQIGVGSEGKLVLRQPMIAGNLHELLRDGVEMIGNDLRSSMGVGVSTYSPTVKLAQLTIAGK